MRCYKIQSKFLVSLLFFVLSAFFFVSNTAAQQQGKLIEAVDIQGNRHLTDEEILKHIQSRPGQRLDEKQLQQDLQSLTELGVFDATNTAVLTESGTRGGVWVIFEVQELPLISAFKIEGLHYVNPKEILAELRERKTEVKVGTPFQPQKMTKARHVVLEYFSKRGFPDAKFLVLTEYVTATMTSVKFIIDELPSVEEDDCCEDDKLPNGSVKRQPARLTIKSF